ncbi:MAG: response regulator [Phycisphaerae bacterium]|nr:response regulator [Phycisphaerae bacterium]
MTTTQERPRLLVLSDPSAEASDVLSSLRERFDVVVAAPGSALDIIRRGECRLVLAEAADFVPLERDLVEREASVVLNALGEGVCVADIEGRPLWSNDRFRTYPQAMRARIMEVCRSAGEGFRAALGQIGSTDAAGSLEPTRSPGLAGRRFDVSEPDDSRFYEVLASPVLEPTFGADQARVRVAALVWDVTRMRRAQRKMEAINRAGAELVRFETDSAKRRSVGDRLRLVEEKIIRLCHELMHFDHFLIRLIDPQTQRLEMVVASGLPQSAIELEIYARAEGNGISGYVAATGQSYLCEDTRSDPRYLAGLHEARSSLTVPLRLNDKIIGIFNIESNEPHAFTEEDRQYAEIFANHIALALHILDLLVIERCTTGQAVSGTVQGEISEPLEDLAKVADRLREAAASQPELARIIERITTDVDSIRRRVREVGAGPQTLLGAEKAIAEGRIDPLLLGKRILVADDEPRIRQLIRDVLRTRGCDVTVCENGAQAIAALNECGGVNSKARSFDLVLSDIKMPDHNGYEIYAAARRTSAQVPVILMTGFGYDPHHSIVRASQEGLQCVLFKPFPVEQLLAEIQKAIKETV